MAAAAAAHSDIVARARERCESFSVRNAIKAAGVPLRFKPTQPMDAVSMTETPRDVKAAILSLKALPQQQFYWPETAGQGEPTAVSGLPARSQIGWHNRDVNRRLEPLLPALSARGPPTSRPMDALPPPLSARSVAESEVGSCLPPVAPRRRVVHGPYAGSDIVARNSDMDRWAAENSFGSDSRASIETGVSQPTQQAALRSRSFLKESPTGRQWYKPKPSSDVVQFADAFHKSFGRTVFSKQE
eukprot:TRINITY_DN30449_c0_g1_i1.p1 TRINITY_DN30449_c0_g1~~TRINITY_DN30449_c0_g1_i1.p1  ORF type:complete len:244 (+),score=27.18 TRINITY_DN30449_c0_g1_i1:70-801(+)